MRIWKVIFAAVVLFLTGALAGGAAVRLIQRYQASSKSPAGPLAWATQRGELLRLMQRELNLTREQDQAARRLLEESRDRLNREWKKETQRVREEIGHILTPEQRRHLQEIQRNRANRRLENPSREDQRRPEQRRFRNPPAPDQPLPAQPVPDPSAPSQPIRPERER